MLWKEFVQLRRDRFTLGMMLGHSRRSSSPCSASPSRPRCATCPRWCWTSRARSESRAWSRCSRNTGNFDIIEQVPEPRRACTDRIETRAGERGARHPARTIMRDLKRGRGAEAQVIVDAADPLASSAALSGARPGRRRAGRRRSPGPRAAAPPRSTCGCVRGTTRAFGARCTSCPGSSACCCR